MGTRIVKTVCVVLLALIAVGVLAPSAVASTVPALPVAHSHVVPVVLPADPPSPSPGTDEKDPQEDPGGEATPAPGGLPGGEYGSRPGGDSGETQDHRNKGNDIPGGVRNKLKSDKEVSDDVAKKAAEKAQDEGNDGDSDDGGILDSLKPSTWVKKGLETATKWIGDALGRAAAWVITSALAIVFGAGSPDLGADYIYTWTGRVFAVAIPITITLAFWQLAKSAIQARGLSGVRRAAGGTVAATAASMVTLPILVSLTSGVDGLRSAMVSWLGLDVEKLSKQITDIFSLETFLALAGVSPGSAAGAAVAISIGFGLFCLFTIFFAIVLLFVMLLRGVFLQAAAVVCPVAYSGLAADETRAWPRTVLGWLLALLVAPFGIVIVLGIGFLGLAEIGQAKSITDGLTQIATCAATLLGALACPWVSYKLFSFLGEDAVASMVSQMRGAVIAGAGVVGNTVKSVVGAASSPTEGGAIGQTVKSAASQGAYGTTDGAGVGAGGSGGAEAQAAGEQQGQDEQKAKAAAAAAAVATGGASAAAGAGAGAAGGSGGAAASSSGAGSGAAGGASASSTSVAGAGSGGGGFAPNSAPASTGSGGGSVGSVAGAPVEGSGAMGGGTAGPAPVGGDAFAGAGSGGGGFAPAPAGGGAAGDVGSVASAPPAGYGYNSAPPPPAATSYSSSSLYGYNSPGGSGYGGYNSDYQGYRSASSAEADTEAFTIPGDADVPIGAEAFWSEDDPRYWQEA